MFTLPRLVTPHAVYRLPLVDPTAERLADALLESDPPRRCQRFTDTVAADPALAIWSLARAHQAGVDPLTTCASAAEWLAQQDSRYVLPEPVVDPAGESSPAAHLAASAGRSLAVAELAEAFARHIGADAERAYFLGLVHLGAAWLVESAMEPDPIGAAERDLPAWLVDATKQLAHPASEPPTEIACVRRAMELVASTVADEWRAMGCDAGYWTGRWNVVGQAWARGGAWGARLVAILGRLASLEELQKDFQRALESAKLEALKELAYGAGHEINNPLANISARAQTLLADERDPDRRRVLAAINAQAFRAHEMITDMMLFARPPQPKKKPCDVAALVRKVHRELAEQAALQHSELALHGADAPLVITIDPTQIAVALKSLCTNALEALVTGGCVEITLLLPDSGERRVRIRVSDNGPGIPDDARPHVFEPFYSGREAGRGLGLGLSKCWRIVELHAGEIDVDSSAGAGATFTIALPADGAC